MLNQEKSGNSARDQHFFRDLLQIAAFESVMARVTRLVEFSSIERLFTLAHFLKVTEVAHIFGILVSKEKVTYVISLTKIGLGYILGDFIINSSGRPGYGTKIFLSFCYG
jgi:hypothetical protein